MKVISLKCPECSASLSVEEGRDQLFCQYCGAKIVLQNENERIYRRIDEADVKRSETERLIRLKELEMEAAKREDEKASKRLKVKISLALLVVGIAMAVFGNFLGEASGNPDSSFYAMSVIGIMLMMGAGYIWLFSACSNDDKKSKKRKN